MKLELAVDNSRKQTITSTTVDGDGGGPHDSDMSERIASVEKQLAAIDGKLTGIAHGQSLLVGSFGLLAAVAALTFGGMIYVAQKVDSLPAQVASDIREANRAFSDAINTSLNVIKQAPASAPRVIVCPPIDDPNPFMKYVRPPECPPIPEKK